MKETKNLPSECTTIIRKQNDSRWITLLARSSDFDAMMANQFRSPRRHTFRTF